MVDVAGTKGAVTIVEGVPGVAGEGEAEVVVVIVSKFESSSVCLFVCLFVCRSWVWVCCFAFVMSYCNAKCSAWFLILLVLIRQINPLFLWETIQMYR